ncbi:YggT family protein [Vagococcus carniphilus]|uniref:YggT family protein n=1 Tax=Vagococcus carniphilus TaxID=218144 RepID=A0A430B921_9ENTE|nr:YggT family protein [Vagococcus carniphilus]MDT2813854.1 YggT family protein [Vagococcus carniphilus]MDT2829857.1 YggT family protein [Vagococcus carniphilus]MDT2834844.1 YggT family protein [Vagococcus carniphilus]MDT2838291.1 YggT family protein [Vagococcus carniphilus]MDT2850026.1 YggT family protein [Vagococcus carniphilus]
MIMIQLLTLLLKVVQVYSFVLVAYALMSWFPGAYETKLGQLIIKISRPYLSLFDRLNLSFGPIDFTIIVALFVLNFASKGLVMFLSRILYGI